jgi:hypothetical protein
MNNLHRRGAHRRDTATEEIWMSDREREVRRAVWLSTGAGLGSAFWRASAGRRWLECPPVHGPLPGFPF